MPSSGPGNQSEAVEWSCQRPLMSAFDKLREYLQETGCPKKLIQSEPLNLCVNDVGGPLSTGYFVTGAQFELSWKIGPKLKAVIWEVRWDADNIKGEHVNLKITPRGDLLGSKMTWAFCSNSEHESSSVRLREETEYGNKPLLTSQSMYALTMASGFDCTAEKARDNEYRKKCAEEVLSY